MILKAKGKELKIELKIRKVSDFELKKCDKKETLLTVLASKCVENDRIEFLVDMLSEFQSNKEDKLSKDELYDFIDDYLEESRKDITTIYTDIIEEMDVMGVINKGLGFIMSKRIKQGFDQMKKQAEKDLNQENLNEKNPNEEDGLKD